MGALHKGHISLIEASKKTDTLTICSIFVNPTQFNNKADFEKYPVTIEKDIDLLEKACCNVLFLPSVEEIYPADSSTTLPYELGFIETVLDKSENEGAKSRVESKLKSHVVLNEDTINIKLQTNDSELAPYGRGTSFDIPKKNNLNPCI